jgi:hypothetical protein
MTEKWDMYTVKPEEVEYVRKMAAADLVVSTADRRLSKNRLRFLARWIRISKADSIYAKTIAVRFFVLGYNIRGLDERLKQARTKK